MRGAWADCARVYKQIQRFNNDKAQKITILLMLLTLLWTEVCSKHIPNLYININTNVYEYISLQNTQIYIGL